jgi:cytosine/uracil/thiamine/allantoin permease
MLIAGLTVSPQQQEAAMTDGLILLAFIAILIAVTVARLRRRMGIPVRAGFYSTAIVGIAIAILVYWVASSSR